MAAEPARVDAAPVGPHRPRWLETIDALAANRLALLSLVILAGFVIAGLGGERLAPHSPTAIDVPNRLQPPSLAHLFGTDDLGRDVFSRVLVGARVSLQVGFIAVGISLVAGVTLGLLAGFYRRLDDVVMRVMDMLFAFPPILLAIAILAGGPLTGASLNPARTFGPAAVSGAARDPMMYLIYFVGPLLGAALATGVYRLLNTPETGPELEPIPDVEEAALEADLDDELEEETEEDSVQRKTSARE